jgi:hypothetical protein
MLISLSEVSEIKEILNNNKSKMVQVGSTKVFLKEELKYALKNQLSRIRYALTIQALFNMYRIRSKLMKKRKIIYKLQALFLGRIYRR